MGHVGACASPRAVDPSAYRSCGGGKAVVACSHPCSTSALHPQPLPPPQIFCGRLRVMAQPHIRDPPPAPAAAANDGPAGEAAEAAGEGVDGAAAAADHAAAAGGAGEGPGFAAGEEPAAAAAGAPGQQPGQEPEGNCWVPDVMRCRWRRDPQQRRLLPRLRANLRAMALCALIIGGAQSACWLLKGHNLQLGRGCAAIFLSACCLSTVQWLAGRETKLPHIRLYALQWPPATAC